MSNNMCIKCRGKDLYHTLNNNELIDNEFQSIQALTHCSVGLLKIERKVGTYSRDMVYGTIPTPRK